MFKIFKRKTQKEKEILKLETQLHNYQQLRDFWRPQLQKRVFRDDKVEVISDDRIKKIVEYEEKIKGVKQKLAALKNE